MDPHNLSPLQLHAWGFLQTPTFQSSAFYPYTMWGAAGAASRRGRWAGSWVGQPGCPTVPNQEQHWWWPGSANSPSLQTSPQWWGSFLILPAKARKSISSSGSVSSQVTRHRRGCNVSTAPEPRWEACLFLLPCAGASHCNPAGDGKVERYNRPFKTLLFQTTWHHTDSLCLFEMVFNAGAFSCSLPCRDIQLCIHSSILTGSRPLFAQTSTALRNTKRQYTVLQKIFRLNKEMLTEFRHLPKITKCCNSGLS